MLRHVHEYEPVPVWNQILRVQYVLSHYIHQVNPANIKQNFFSYDTPSLNP